MNIEIIGGGPAGLYLACSIKQLNPRACVTIHEARHASVHARGLGYTLQHLGIQLLRRLDPDFMAGLFPGGAPIVIREALVKTDAMARTVPFSTGVSVARDTLIHYLTERASALGVTIMHRHAQRQDITNLARESDLVIGADGVNSAVRARYGRRFGARTQALNMHYSWFINESEQERTEACFYAFRAPEGVVMLTSYPLSHTKQITIVEMSETCLNTGQFRDKDPAQAAPYLNRVFSTNGDHMGLRSAGLPWYRFQTNSVDRFHYRNTALVGDAAMAFHYSAGQGVTNAFTMAYTLASCLQRNSTITEALQHYSTASSLALRDAEKKMQARAEWLERIDRHFAQAPEEQLLDLFLQQQEVAEWESSAK